MYGTVAKMKVKPGMLDKMRALANDPEFNNIPGWVSTTIYQMDSDANELIMTVAFESKDAYVKNAESPEQDKRYEEFASLLAGPPEWNDGEIIYASS